MIDPLRLTADGLLGTRPAESGDRSFAEGLYLETAERAALGGPAAWDEAAMRARFGAVYSRSRSWILSDGERAVGWLQIDEGRSQVSLDQLHFVPGSRGRGLGTRIMRELQDQAGRHGKAVVLKVLKGNTAVAFYERLGFVVTREDERRLYMRWRPGAGGPGAGSPRPAPAP